MNATLPQGPTPVPDVTSSTTATVTPTMVHMALKVTLDSSTGTVSISGPGYQNGTISVDTDYCLIVFTAETQAGQQPVLFPTNPIDWVSGTGIPIPPPNPFAVQRNNDIQITILDCNSMESPTPFPFTISVFSGGKTFTSSDPTILNKPPA